MDDDGFLVIDDGRCDLCGACVAVCGPLALTIRDTTLAYDPASCTACGDCILTCPVNALSGSS